MHKPCAYKRENMAKVAILQFFFPFLGAGAFILGWTAWGVALLLLCVCSYLSYSYSQMDISAEDTHENNFQKEQQMNMAFLSKMLMTTFIVCSIMIFMLILTECIDAEGVECYSPS